MTQENQTTTDLLDGEFKEIWGKEKWKNLFAHLDISSLVYFRIAFGLIMLYEVYHYFATGWISRYWIEPQFNFKYFPFLWLEPLPGDGMYYLFYSMGLFCILIIIGLFYRASITLLTICFTYSYLLEQTRYLNHFYLICLIMLVMIFLPLHHAGSFDRKIFKNIHSETAPSWTLWLIRFMIALPYFFGGIAKINPDWLRGQPLTTWIKSETSFPVIGPLLDELWMGLLMSYAGMLLDLLIVPALLYRPTRVAGFVLITLFHLMNHTLFNIGIFPWFMIAATTLFFSPDWPRRIVNALSGKENYWPLEVPSGQRLTTPVSLSKSRQRILTMLAIWVGLQCFLPFRHLFFPGNVHWTEEGHKYAWHMKLRAKSARGSFYVVDKATGLRTEVNSRKYLETWQERKAKSRPYLIWQFAKFLQEIYAKQGKDVSVYADIKVSLNYRPYQQYTNPNIDLAAIESFPLFPSRIFIYPLLTPLEGHQSVEVDFEDTD